MNVDNEQDSMGEVTRKDIARAIHHLAYRKAYNASTKARTARKERAERIKAALEYIKQHPEVLR